jgi:hypothetical protein
LPRNELRQLVGSRFQVLFHSPPGVLFTFPSRYWFTIGRQGVLSLRGWAPQIHTGFHVPRATWEHHSETGRLSPTGLLPSLAVLSCNLRLAAGFVTPSQSHRSANVGPTTPARKRRWAVTPCRFRLIPVRSPLLRESRLLSLPRPTEMFHFGRFPPQALCVQTWVTGHDPGRVSPFGHLRITALLAAPRSFSQPHASFVGSWRQGIHRKPLIT